jgi:hypothetical protein
MERSWLWTFPGASSISWPLTVSNGQPSGNWGWHQGSGQCGSSVMIRSPPTAGAPGLWRRQLCRRNGASVGLTQSERSGSRATYRADTSGGVSRPVAGRRLLADVCVNGAIISHLHHLPNSVADTRLAVDHEDSRAAFVDRQRFHPPSFSPPGSPDPSRSRVDSLGRSAMSCTYPWEGRGDDGNQRPQLPESHGLTSRHIIAVSGLQSGWLPKQVPLLRALKIRCAT